MLRWAHGGATFVAAGLCLLVAIPCGAQDAEEPDLPEARAVFLRATELYENGSFARAELEFRRTWEMMEGHPRRSLVLINIARCIEEQGGRDEEALRLYEQAIANTNAIASTDDGVREARSIAEARIAELTTRLRLSGRADAEEEEEDLAPPPAERVSAGPDLTGPIIVTASGGAVLLAGVVTGVATALEHDQLANACPEMRCELGERNRIDTVRALGITTDVLLAVGGAAAAAGLVWLIIELTSNAPTEAPVTAACGPNGCSLTLRGSL